MSNLSIPKGFKRKHLQTLNELFAYFNIKKAMFKVESDHFLYQLPNAKAIQLDQSKQLDLIYVSEKSAKSVMAESIFNSLTESGVMIFEKPYNNLVFWETLKANPNAQVTVNTYFFGFIFTQKTQAKEAFFIRL